MKAIVLTRSILTTLPVIGLAAALTLAAPSDIHAGHQWTNPSGSVGYHWKRVDVDPLVLRIQDNHDSYVSENYPVDWPAIFLALTEVPCKIDSSTSETLSVKTAK